jgi:hypothetical protein
VSRQAPNERKSSGLSVEGTNHEHAESNRGVITAGGRGRPPGKRRHPDFEHITAYIRRDTHCQVKLALLRELKGRQFSDLVEELLAVWLKSHR